MIKYKLMLLLAVLFTVSSFTPNTQTSYCDGFKEGYSEGYCFEIEICNPPIPPLCPIPDIGRTTYKDGYNKGFNLGYKRQKQ